MEIVISLNGQYIIPCMNGLFSLRIVVKEIIDYRHREGTGTIVIYHDPSLSFSRVDQKNFLVVPLSRIRGCQGLTDDTLSFSPK
jgi:hypothetical protein